LLEIFEYGSLVASTGELDKAAKVATNKDIACDGD
jgi:hypothetical protein